MTHPAVPSPSSDMMAITVASRIPEFWEDQVLVWFLRTEAILAPQKLSEEAKFDLVVSKLSKETITQLADFICKPPEIDRYKALKSKLLNLYEESATRQVEKLIKEMELGDQKPSQLLTKMRALAKDKIPNDTLRILWQRHLPSTVRAVLTVSDAKDLDSLARIGDNVVEATQIDSVAAISKGHSVNSHSDSAIVAEIAKLNARIDSWERGRDRQRSVSRHRSPRRRSSTRSSTRSGLPRRTPESPDWLCFYHFRFKNRANKCVKPCAWIRPEN